MLFERVKTKRKNNIDRIRENNSVRMVVNYRWFVFFSSDLKGYSYIHEYTQDVMHEQLLQAKHWLASGVLNSVT